MGLLLFYLKKMRGSTLGQHSTTVLDGVRGLPHTLRLNVTGWYSPSLPTWGGQGRGYSTEESKAHPGS